MAAENAQLQNCAVLSVSIPIPDLDFYRRGRHCRRASLIASAPAGLLCQRDHGTVRHGVFRLRFSVPGALGRCAVSPVKLVSCYARGPWPAALAFRPGGFTAAPPNLCSLENCITKDSPSSSGAVLCQPGPASKRGIRSDSSGRHGAAPEWSPVPLGSRQAALSLGGLILVRRARPRKSAVGVSGITPPLGANGLGPPTSPA